MGLPIAEPISRKCRVVVKIIVQDLRGENLELRAENLELRAKNQKLRDESLELLAENQKLKEGLATVKQELASFKMHLANIDRLIYEKRKEYKEDRVKAREAEQGIITKRSEQDKHRYMMWSSILCAIIFVIPQIDRLHHPSPGTVSDISAPFAGATLVALYMALASYLGFKDAKNGVMAYEELRDDLNESPDALRALEEMRAGWASKE